jgi:hypothetical protein
MFGGQKRKDARLGSKYQASAIPLVTDIMYYEYLQELDRLNEHACSHLWQQDRLPPESVGKRSKPHF